MDAENLLGELTSHFRCTWQFYYTGISLLLGTVLHSNDFTDVTLKV